MPSIEIVCIGQSEPLDCAGWPFAIEASTKLESHRSPDPRFQTDFDALSGCIYHLGNPELKGRSEGAFFAYELLSDASQHAEPSGRLEFCADLAGAIFEFVEVLLDASPDSRLLFTSDWQFGPEHTLRLDAVTLTDFKRLHDTGALLLNAAYTIHVG